MPTERSKIIRRPARLLALAAAGAIALATPGIAAAENGPDVSSWQHVNGTLINWFQVKGAGQQFAMVKATEGLNYVNPYFVQDSLLMRAAGVARGTYHYADVSAPAAPQAALFATVTLGQNGPLDLPPVIDFEDAKGQSPAQLIGWLHQYLDTAQALTGRQPIIYTYPNFWRNAMGNTTQFSNYPLWIADYNGKKAPGPLPGGWNHWTFWQYTSTGRLPGVAGNVDLNTYSGAQGPFGQYARVAALSSGSVGS